MKTLIIEPVGRILIVSGLVLQIIGGIVIKKMLVLDF
jgi:Flp pilus assembly protein TadB